MPGKCIFRYRQNLILKCRENLITNYESCESRVENRIDETKPLPEQQHSFSG